MAGVKEYWIVNPINDAIAVYHFSDGEYTPDKYTFNDTIKPGIYDDFEIDFSKLDI